MLTMTKEDAIRIGGREWNGTRVYFNNLLELADGVTIGFYGTGNVSRAMVDGSAISNNKGRALVSEMGVAKVWLDIESGTVLTKNLSPWLVERVLRGLQRKLNEQKAA